MGVRNYLVEGVSGTGKTAVCTELRRRGLDAVHGDRVLAYPGDPETGEPRESATGVAAHGTHVWDEALVASIVADRRAETTFFCGGSRNASRFIHLFDEVFVLTVDATTLAHRLDRRGPDEWGGRGRTAERALIEQLHRTGSDTPRAGIRIDAARPLTTVVDDILRQVGRRTAEDGRR